MKKYSDWDGSLTEYLNVGDLVDESFVDHFINVLPPACHTNQIVQMGEPYSHREDKPTYHTLMKTSDGWVYAGTCHRGKTVHLP